MCSISSEDLKNGNISLISAFFNNCKSYLKFCTTCNKKGESYYTQDIYLKTGEEAIYCQYLINDIRNNFN